MTCCFPFRCFAPRLARIGIILLFLVQAKTSSGITHFAVETRPNPARPLAPSLGKLSPDLRAVSANGSFVGMTNDGEAVIQFKQEIPFATALESITKNPEVKGVEEVNPERFL
jgi:hypothetical protein